MVPSSASPGRSLSACNRPILGQEPADRPAKIPPTFLEFLPFPGIVAQYSKHSIDALQLQCDVLA